MNFWLVSASSFTQLQSMVRFDSPEKERILDKARSFVVSPHYRQGIKRIYQRFLIPAGELSSITPPLGWKIESIGPSFDPAQPDAICLTVWRPMPRVPSPGNILHLASEVMEHGRARMTLSWMAPMFHLAENHLLCLLLKAGLRDPTNPQDTNKKFVFSSGRIFWLTKEGAFASWTLHSKLPESDPDKIDYEMPF